MNKLSIFLYTLIFSCTLTFEANAHVPKQAEQTQQTEQLRYFLVTGEPSAKGWENAINNPSDREQAMSGFFKNMGGELISYYFGLGNGKNYIIVALPNDPKLIQALYLLRLPTGWLNSYSMVELMPSSQMHKALTLTQEMLKKS